MLILSVWVLTISPLSLPAQGSEPNTNIKTPQLQPIKQKPIKPIKSKAEPNQETQSTPDPSPRITEAPPKPLENAFKDCIEKCEKQIFEFPEFVVLLGYKLKLTDGLLVIFTLLLVFVGFGQVWFNRSLRNNQRIIERAYVKMSHHPPGLDQFMDSLQYEVSVQIKNFGHTPATITEIGITYILVPYGKPLPNHPNCTYERGTHKTGLFLVKDDEFTLIQGFSILDDEWEPIKSKKSDLYVLGYVDYIDKFGTRHRATYARKYDPRVDFRNGYTSDESFRNRNNLKHVTQPRYNDDRPRQQGEGNDWETHL